MSNVLVKRYVLKGEGIVGDSGYIHSLHRAVGSRCGVNQAERIKVGRNGDDVNPRLKFTKAPPLYYIQRQWNFIRDFT
jgi:hypothetical protein